MRPAQYVRAKSVISKPLRRIEKGIGGDFDVDEEAIATALAATLIRVVLGSSTQMSKSIESRQEGSSAGGNTYSRLNRDLIFRSSASSGTPSRV